MVGPIWQRWLAAAFAGFVLVTACDDPESPSNPAAERPKPYAQLLPTGDGTLAVGVTSTGSGIDPDGYTVWVDFSLSQAIGTAGLATFSGLAPGVHAVALFGNTSNCGVNTLSQGPNNPRGVSLTEGVAGSTNFDVRCSSWGGLFISTNTTGVDLDADGYTVTVDGERSVAVPTNGSVTLTDVFEGTHSVALSGFAGNCTLSGPNPRPVTISPGKTTSLVVSASCVPTGTGSGSLTVTTTTTGSHLDLDGYTVTIDGTSNQAIAANDIVTFTGAAGNHPVALSGVASNCSVSGGNPRTVAVPADGTGTTAFSITCDVPQARVAGKGQTGIGSSAPHQAVLSFDFEVRADLTGRLTITAWDDLHPNGSFATFTTDASTDPATSFTAYRNSSSACRDPSRGVEIEGLAWGDEGYVASYIAIACDDGAEGSDSDFFSFYIPSEGGGRSGMVTSGDVGKR